jgi:hypothetical protein
MSISICILFNRILGSLLHYILISYHNAFPDAGRVREIRYYFVIFMPIKINHSVS